MHLTSIESIVYISRYKSQQNYIILIFVDKKSLLTEVLIAITEIPYRLEGFSHLRGGHGEPARMVATVASKMMT
jgi:hypothetical protein